jgi:hypothetical protein
MDRCRSETNWDILRGTDEPGANCRIRSISDGGGGDDDDGGSCSASGCDDDDDEDDRSLASNTMRPLDVMV